MNGYEYEMMKMRQHSLINEADHIALEEFAKEGQPKQGLRYHVGLALMKIGARITSAEAERNLNRVLSQI